MNTNLIVTADELITMYRDGERRGFIAGVIFSVGGYALIRKMNREDRRTNPFKARHTTPE